MFGKSPRVDHLTAAVLCSERFKLVRGDDEVGEGVETKRPVVVPVHRAHVEGEGDQAEGATETVEGENITGGWPVFVTEEVREAIFTLCF